jgi:hypothetical protein
MPSSPMTGIVTIFVFCGFFAMVAFTVWVVVTGRRHREHMRFMADFTTRMLDRMASTRDFADFLQSEAATKLLANLAPERTSAGPQREFSARCRRGSSSRCWESEPLSSTRAWRLMIQHSRLSAALRYRSALAFCSRRSLRTGWPESLVF